MVSTHKIAPPPLPRSVLPPLCPPSQPALLYLVPCTLGLFVFLSYNDGTLRSMWDGPPSLSADHVGYDGLLSDGGGGADAGKLERLGLGEGARSSGPGERRHASSVCFCCVDSSCTFLGYNQYRPAHKKGPF